MFVAPSLFAALTWIALGASLALAGVAAGRRLAGTAHGADSGAALVAAIFVVLVAATLREAARHTLGSSAARTTYAALASVLVACALVALAPGRFYPALLIGLLTLLLEGGAWVEWAFASVPTTMPIESECAPVSAAPASGDAVPPERTTAASRWDSEPHESQPHEADEEHEFDECDEEGLPSQMSQHIWRESLDAATVSAATPPDAIASDVAGPVERQTRGERVTALLRVRLDAGRRRAHVHLPFCPPLPRTPSVEAQVVEGEGSVAVEQAASYGVRLEVQAGGSDSPQELVVELIAIAAVEEAP